MFSKFSNDLSTITSTFASIKASISIAVKPSKLGSFESIKTLSKALQAEILDVLAFKITFKAKSVSAFS
ncbi:hypothetical protein D3C86_1735510 [compost metagenome]